MTNEYLKIVENAIKYHEERGHIMVVEVLKGVRTRMRQVALDKMAENARELGLDYLTPDQVKQVVRQLLGHILQQPQLKMRQMVLVR